MSVAGSASGDDELISLIASLTQEELEDLVESLPPIAAQTLLDDLSTVETEPPQASPIEQALVLGEPFRLRPQLEYLSGVIVDAVRDVEAGIDRKIIVQMPPRSGKTTMLTLLTPAWILARHPDWSIALTSHDGTLATSWGRQVRRWAEAGKLGPHVKVAPDAGAASGWETTEHGSLLAVSTRESFTGRGARVLCIDDPLKDFVDAHSATIRESVWNWWRSVAQTRLEPPSLVIVTLTRWHENDIVGRILSTDYDGDPADWQVINLPAIAEENDQLGRAVGDPLMSPIIEETTEQAIERLAAVRRSVGTYTWAALYQQRPAPASGAIFNSDWWRYWTLDPGKAISDGRVRYVDPETLGSGRWLDSWDCAFVATADSDWVVGQRWVRSGPDRYLIAQTRGRWTFTETLTRMRSWAHGGGPYGKFVHQRLIEAKANGPAILDTLKEEIAGLKPINPKTSKMARAQSITPECESGNVYLPYPGDPGNEWVRDILLPELRDFPGSSHDDQVDGLSQALTELREKGRASVTIPGRATASATQSPTRQRPINPARETLGRLGRSGLKIGS
jgi:predicted phage terminase large subunit-like protein